MDKGIIIHPTDFSDCANKALKYAIFMAKALNCKLKVVHSLVFNDLGEFRQNPTALIADSKKVEKEAEVNLKKIGEIVKSQGIDCEMTIYTGKISAWFPDYVDKYKPSLIVMGTTGASSFSNKFFGSNTYSVIKNTKYPLLAVPKNATVEKIKKIIFSTDYKDADIQSIDFLSRIATHFESNIEVTHIIDSETKKKENNQILFDKLKSKVGAQVPYKNIKYKLFQCDDVLTGIQLLLEESKPDLFSLVMRKQGFLERFLFGSITEKMVYHTETPMVIFPEED